jgi:hypothetical protein
MIIKSMSRKEPSFGQLMDYIDRDGGEELYRIRYNLAGRDRSRVRSEFEANASRLRERKNGVFMYHEIISLTRAKGLSLAEQKERLHHIAQQYVAARAPRNLCYGGLHADKGHSIHYHLMISSNRAGEEKRHRLSKEQFRDIQISLERHVLSNLPELEQKLAIEQSAESRISKKESELKRRTGQTPEREEVARRVQTACDQARDKDSLFAALGQHALDLYVRGSLLGVVDRQTGKRHRVRTLSAELVTRLETMLHAKGEAERIEPQVDRPPPRGPAVEKEKKRVEPTETKKPEVDIQRQWREEAERRRSREKSRDRDDKQER